jgi:hypothetical protein
MSMDFISNKLVGNETVGKFFKSGPEQKHLRQSVSAAFGRGRFSVYGRKHRNNGKNRKSGQFHQLGIASFVA